MKAKRIIARLLLSLVGGTALFLAVTIATGVLSTYYPYDSFAHTLLMLPSRWPRYAYVYLSPASLKPSLYFDHTASLVALIACDVAFYSLIVFSLTVLFSAARRRRVSDDPPPPPRQHSA